MKIQKGLVKYKDRSDIVCTYGITDEGKQYYFINDRKLSNNNIIVTSTLVEAIDHSVVPSNIGVINSEGKIVIECVNKSIKLITKDILLVEKANPTSPSVVEALKNRKDPLAATKLVSNSAAIKEKMAGQMGSDARFIFNDQFSEASLFDIGGKNLLNNKYYSFIALNKRGDTIFLSDNVQTSGVDSLSLTSMQFNDTTNVDASIPSNLSSDNKLDVTDASVNKESIDNAMNENISKLGDDTISDVPPVVEDVPAVPEVPQVPEVPSGVVVPPMNVEPEKPAEEKETKDQKIVVPIVTGDNVDTSEETEKEEEPKQEEQKEEKTEINPNRFIDSDGRISIPAKAIADYNNQDNENATKLKEDTPPRKMINSDGYIAIPAKAIEEMNRGEFPTSVGVIEDTAPDKEEKDEEKETSKEDNYDNADVVDVSIAGEESSNDEDNKEETTEEKQEEIKEDEEETLEENKENAEKADSGEVDDATEGLISDDLLAGLAVGTDTKEKTSEEAKEVEEDNSQEELKEEKDEEKEEVSENNEESFEEDVETSDEEEPKKIDDEPVKIDDDSTVEDLLNGDSEIDDFLNSDTSSVLDDTYRYVPKKDTTSFSTNSSSIMNNAVDTITRLIEANKNQKNELNQYKNQVTELTDLNKKVVDKARSDREKVKSSIQNYEVEITKLKAKMESLESKINEKESTIRNQTKELADLRTQVEGSNNLAKVLADAQSILGE